MLKRLEIKSCEFCEIVPAILVFSHQIMNESLSLVFCCYQLVYDIVETSYLWVILQVRGRDGMFTPQNGATAYSVSCRIFARVVSHCLS